MSGAGGNSDTAARAVEGASRQKESFLNLLERNVHAHGSASADPATTNLPLVAEGRSAQFWRVARGLLLLWVLWGMAGGGLAPHSRPKSKSVAGSREGGLRHHLAWPAVITGATPTPPDVCCRWFSRAYSEPAGLICGWRRRHCTRGRRGGAVGDLPCLERQ